MPQLGGTMEIERKWMVSGWPALPLLYTEYQEQGYVHSDAPIVRIRMESRQTTQYVLCFKSAGLLTREEIEINISREEFDRLSGLIGLPLIRKTRRVYQLHDGLKLEVNMVDEGLPTQFMYAEVEYQDEAQARAWRPEDNGLDDYLTDDVTEKPGQSMSAYWARTRLTSLPPLQGL